MSAPSWNSVDVFKGEVEKRPSKFMAALSEADNLCAELDGLRELQTRLAEVEAERDDLAEKLRVGDEAHQITLGRLAKAITERDRARNERDDMRSAVSQ